MNELPRKNLISLVQKNGNALCRDAVRCEGLLRDLCPGCSREIAVLLSALRQQVGIDLLSPPPGVSREHHLHALSRRLYDNQGICEQFAWWAVISWALALGVIAQESEVKPPRELVRGQKVVSGADKAKILSSRPLSLIVAADGSGHTVTIGEAVGKAPPHTSIFIRPGRYRESLILTAPLQLIGEGRPSEVVIEGVEGPCLTLRAPSCLVHGLTLEYKTSTEADADSAALTFLRGEAVVEDCTLISAGTGILIRGGRVDPVIRRCSILGSGERGICIEKAKGLVESCRIEGPARGIVVRGKTEATIRSCSLSHGHIGIEVNDRGYAVVDNCRVADQSYACLVIQGASQPEVRGCTFQQAQFGVEVTDRGKGSLDQCTVQGCAQGILIAERADPSLSACTVQHNQFGIRVTSSGRGDLRNSDISENEFAGISIKEGGKPHVSGCRITRNGDVGIWIQKSGLGVIEGNDLRGNRKGGISLETGSQAQVQKNLL
ncbi:MAG: right-handed parallel beta-helix repeat-containing protein [Methanolinea sp.]|nr:right-handed parallel beta-helix repeat-containing protein [Methanolinea sp.]